MENSCRETFNIYIVLVISFYIKTTFLI